MSENLRAINKKANRRHKLYLELGHLIEGSTTVGFFGTQVEEIKRLDSELIQLWRSYRAEGKIWMPRLREGSRGQQYERKIRPGAHGYR